MSLYGFLLVLAAAFSHATWNFFVKRINAGPELVWLFSAISVLPYSPLAVYFLWITPGFGMQDYGLIAVSAILHLGYFLLLQAGYRKGELSLIYPLARATGPLLSTGLAVLVLNEPFAVQTGIGAAVIVTGVLMLTGGIRAPRHGAGISLAFGLGAGLLIGGYTVWDAHAVSVAAIPPLLLDYASSVGRSLLLAPIAARRRAKIGEIWRDHKAGVLAIAVFNPLAYILVLVALTFTPIVYVAPIREVSVILTVLAGSLFLGEGELKHRLVWATVIFAGVALLATS